MDTGFINKIEQFRETSFDNRINILNREIQLLNNLSYKDKVSFKQGLTAVLDAARLTNYAYGRTTIENYARAQNNFALPLTDSRHILYNLPERKDNTQTQYLFYKKNDLYYLADQVIAKDKNTALQIHAQKVHLIRVLAGIDIKEDELPGVYLLKMQILKKLITTADFSQTNLEKLIDEGIASYVIPNDEHYEFKRTKLEEFKNNLYKSITNNNTNFTVTDLPYIDFFNNTHASVISNEGSHLNYNAIVKDEADFAVFDFPTIIQNLNQFNPEETALLCNYEGNNFNDQEFNRLLFNTIKTRLEFSVDHLQNVRNDLLQDFHKLSIKLNSISDINFKDLLPPLLSALEDLKNGGEITLKLLEIMDKTYRVLTPGGGVTWQEYANFVENISQGQSNSKLVVLAGILMAIAGVGLALLPSPGGIIFAGFFAVAGIYTFFKSRSHGLHEAANKLAKKGLEQQSIFADRGEKLTDDMEERIESNTIPITS